MTASTVDAEYTINRLTPSNSSVAQSSHLSDFSVLAIAYPSHRSPRYALLRLHGRNTKTWNIKGATTASDRFNYDYPENELADLVPRLERLALTALQTHVIFNNNMEDQGQRNAASLAALLKS